MSAQSFHDQNFFSDSAFTSGHLKYAVGNLSNLIFSKSSQLLDPVIASNNTLLADVRYEWSPDKRWTIYVHTERTRLLMFARYGVDIGEWNEFDIPGINKFYDNGEMKIYMRSSKLSG